MVRSELVARLRQLNPHLYEREAEGVVDAIFDRIIDALVGGDRVELRGFGSFEVRQMEARPGRNPRTGAVAEVAAKAKVHFKPGKPMRDMLNPDTASSPQASSVAQAS